MQAPPWRIWLTTLLTIFWAGLAIWLYFYKNDPLVALLCVVMALSNALFLYQMTNGWRSGPSQAAADTDSQGESISEEREVVLEKKSED